MSTFLETSKKVVKVLRDNNFCPEADELNELAENYADKGDSEVKKQIIEMCHIKWLGDLNVTTMPSSEWLGMLADLKRK